MRPQEPAHIALETAVEALGRRIELLRTHINATQRIIIALAGPPGSGKSTVTAKLLSHLVESGIEDVAVMPMDGYHYPKATLSAMQDPVEAFKRRGAPFTFDSAAFIESMVALRAVRVTAPDEPVTVVHIPSFDHAVQDPVASDISVPSTVRVLIIEGNYTLFDQPPWSTMADLADEKWFVDIPRAVAKHRLAKRHLLAGIEATMEAAESRAEQNDLPNGDLIRKHLLKPDVIIEG